MKSLIVGLVALAAYGVNLNAQAAPSTPPLALTTTVPVSNIGVLDMRQIMEKSTQFAQIRTGLIKEFQPKQQKLVAAQTTLKNDADKLRRDNAIMSNTDRKALEQKIVAEQQELQRMQTGFQQELMAKQNKALKGFLDNIKGVVEKVARAEHLNLVITQETVAYASPNMNITNKVLQQLPHK